MLAEELVAIGSRNIHADAAVPIHCEAARVLCRLAALHDDADYRRAAVIAEGADYRDEAARILAVQSRRARRQPVRRRGTMASRWRNCCGTYDRIPGTL